MRRAAPLNPAMRRVITAMHKAKRTPMHEMTIAAARVFYDKSANILELPLQDLPRVEDFTISARDGYALPVRLYAAGCDERPVLLYLHGGGFTVGSIDSHEHLCRDLAQKSGCAVLALDYRLAPECRFPTAVNDCWDALQWLFNLADSGALIGAYLRIDPSRIAVGGDSAGGALAATMAVMARDRGLNLALQVLIYPHTAGSVDTESHTQSRHLYRSGYVLEATQMYRFFNAYIDTAEQGDWRFAPLNTPNLCGVAPACMVLAECDPLFDEGQAYAARLRNAQVAVQCSTYTGVTHEFVKMPRALAEAVSARAEIATALRAAFNHHDR